MLFFRFFFFFCCFFFCLVFSVARRWRPSLDVGEGSGVYRGVLQRRSLECRKCLPSFLGVLVL
jgi:hypothetical protein